MIISSNLKAKVQVYGGAVEVVESITVEHLSAMGLITDLSKPLQDSTIILLAPHLYPVLTYKAF